MRYKITIEYLGAGFVGWQRQHNGLSVQQVIEQAIFDFSGRKTTIYGAGRTDAGVNAFGQVAHFDLETDYSLTRMRSSLNHFLKPYRVVVLDVEIVNAEFHARFSASCRSYVYHILNRSAHAAIDYDRMWYIQKPLMVELMQEAAQYFIGTHDFTTFQSIGCWAKSPIKTLNNITVQKIDDKIIIYLEAQSFLYHMVRNIVGSLVNVGLGKWPSLKIPQMLELCDRSLVTLMAPAVGLYLYKINY
jgi:tRNA pseudouridine38-40 synthase